MIDIISNGSKWYGEKPDNIENLFENLKKYTLDCRMESYSTNNEKVYFRGNFIDISAVFYIITDESETILKLCELILKNHEMPKYKKSIPLPLSKLKGGKIPTYETKHSENILSIMQKYLPGEGENK